MTWSVLVGLLGGGAALMMAFVNLWKARYERRQVRMGTDAERYRDMVESYHDGMIRVSSGNKIIVANRQARLMTGYAEREIVGMNVNDLLPPQYRRRHLVDVRNFRANPRVRMMGKGGRSLYLLTKRGEQTPVLLSLTPGEAIDNGPEVTVGMRTPEGEDAGMGMPIIAEPEMRE